MLNRYKSIIGLNQTPFSMYWETRNLRTLFVVVATVSSLFSSCKKLVEIDAPSNSLSKANVYASDATAIAVMTGLYTNMSSAIFASGINGISIGAGLSADELDIVPTSDVTLFAQYQNKLTNVTYPSYWQKLYNSLYTVNSAIDGLQSSNLVSTVVKQQLLGEAKFMRGFYYFYLVNLYGDVPLLLGTDYKINGLSSRTSKDQVYQQIIRDFTDAKALLSQNYLNVTLRAGSSERVRPTKWAATAMLARTYLYTNKFDSASLQATEIINNSSLFHLESITSVFLKNSAETIWQLQPVNTGWNTEDAKVFILPDAGPNSYQNPAYLSSFLVKEFEPNDQRFQNWISSKTAGSVKYYYPYKYKSGQYGDPLSEYLMVLRLGEQYLIRGEARAQLNDIAGARADLYAIRRRAGLNDSTLTANDKPSLLTAVLHERQVELFTEWGHRWLDIKRTGNVNAVMNSITPAKGGVWNSNWQYYPIPLSDLQIDPNLIQNAGY